MVHAPQSAAQRLEFRLLGPLEVRADGRPVALGGAKPRALLAVLLLQPGSVVSVDGLIDDLWGERPPKTAAHALQVYVSQLRKALDPGRRGVLEKRAAGYLLDVRPELLDIHRFRRLLGDGRAALRDGDAAQASALLGEALALWRGPALADFAFEPFAQLEIARLEEERRLAAEERIEAELALGRHAELVGELEALVAAEPFRERPRGQLMLALYRSGRQAEALDAYRDARRTLVAELGIEPSPELRALEAAILRQDESLAAPAEPQPFARAAGRRLVTVACTEIGGVPGSLDAEALQQVTGPCVEAIAGAVERHGGTVERSADDAVVAAFGVPVAHEDDAVRAARAALEIRAKVEELGLSASIGIETGEVADDGGSGLGGAVVGTARRLAEVAAPGQVVVSEDAYRLVAHAAEAEPLGAVRLRGREEPVPAWRLVAISESAGAFERRLDAALVGRQRELGLLETALERASRGEGARVVLVLGPAGIGKSRLAAELARRSEGDVTVLAAACPAYGEGITYWPLRSIVGRAAGGTGREAIRAALPAGPDADAIAAALDGALAAAGPGPGVDEVAWAFRRFCEELGRRGPLVLVLDDLHWAAPTFLDLVDDLASRGRGRILAVCLAREDLLEERPRFLAGRENVETVVLDALTAEETEALIEGLTARSALQPETRRRIADAAEGNPLFVEQLLALAEEGGMVDPRPLPPSIRGLLAARLDRLGPGERAVLQRAAVVGKDFDRDSVAVLVEPPARPALDRHLGALVSRGFVRPGAAERAFRFRHGLVQEVAYRALRKAERAALHESFGGWLERQDDAPDELTGYHLEQAYRLCDELGTVNDDVIRIAGRAGTLLGGAGIRASQRDDTPAAVNLLGRAASLLPGAAPARLELLCELAVALRAAGEVGEAERRLEEAAEADDRRLELRARLELASVRLFTDPEGRGEEILRLAEEAIPVFEQLDDDRSLGRTWMLAAYVHGGLHCRIAAWQDAAERALEHYRRSGWSSSTCIGAIAAALFYGPTPVGPAIARCEELRRDPACGRGGEATVLAFRAGLEAQAGRFDEARALVAEARRGFEELGRAVALASLCGPVLSGIELLAGDAAAAESTLRESCETLQRLREDAYLSTRAAELAEVLYEQGRYDEAEEWAGLSERHAASDDVSAQILWRGARAKLLARRGSAAEAEALALDAVGRAVPTDALNQHARALLDLAEVLRLDGRDADADASVGAALELYARKGNVAGAAAHEAREALWRASRAGRSG